MGKAVEGHRSPKPGGNEERPGEREASWSAPALWRFGTQRTMLGDDGNQIGPHTAIRTLHSALERLFSWIHFGLDERGKGRLNNVGSDALFMSVQPFHGKTFVAFMDIEGFKSMMGDGKRAPLALDAFYSAGYTVLKEHRGDAILVDGFFMSDCGVLFVRGENEASSIRLESICRIIQQIHQRTFKKTFQLTTSISWGDFSYDERIEFPGIEKNPIYGSAYVAAFVDSKAHPKLYSSECRLKRDELLPPDIIDWCISKQGAVAERMRETPRHFYYDWMRE
jgi:hypothetical protein